ncbi:hypothetical protein A5482_007985 [Cyanobacterium sp. IPPAS B-1200]|uniref:hypothetical protein n=1 Tax=Cyanobacterium sp. IPPAS B-1200 TaxID=1562720 RepID=UPI0008527D49|nr:hypothetical protein [Cyanobacterium sp. IPPAS B-1200]OEJ77748.1 hypothetical protein A5482_15050 [Cyanobacterium sp. IPPAS B-1200]
MPRVNTFFTITSLIISVIGILTLQKGQLEADIELDEEYYQQQNQLNRLVLDIQTKAPSFGFDNLKANWNYLQYIQYFGDNPARQVTGYPLLPKYFEIIVNNDPRFVRALLSLSTANTLYAVSPKITIRLLDQALEQISPTLDPLTPYIWSYKGVDEMLFLGDITAAKKSYQTAAQWALQTDSPDKEAVAARNLETVQFLEQNPDSKRARVAAWMFILGNGLNEETQQLAIEQITALGGTVTLTPEGNLQVEFPEED